MMRTSPFSNKIKSKVKTRWEINLENGDVLFMGVIELEDGQGHGGERGQRTGKKCLKILKRHVNSLEFLKQS